MGTFWCMTSAVEKVKPVSVDSPRPSVPSLDLNLVDFTQNDAPLRHSSIQRLSMESHYINSPTSSAGDSSTRLTIAKRQVILDVAKRRGKIKMLQYQLDEERSVVDLMILELVD